MPDGFEDVANESDTLWYDEETGCIVVYTNDPGRFTVKLRRENSGSGSSAAPAAPAAAPAEASAWI